MHIQRIFQALLIYILCVMIVNTQRNVDITGNIYTCLKESALMMVSHFFNCDHQKFYTFQIKFVIFGKRKFCSYEKFIDSFCFWIFFCSFHNLPVANNIFILHLSLFCFFFVQNFITYLRDECKNDSN